MLLGSLLGSLSFIRGIPLSNLLEYKPQLLLSDNRLSMFTPFTFTRETFARDVPLAISKLTNNPRYIEPREYIKISRLESICFENRINLSTFFLCIENNGCCISDYEFKEVRTNIREYYEVLGRIAKARAMSGYRICLMYEWDYQNYCREKRLAFNGGRCSFSLMKLFWLLSLLDISFSSFFLCCESYNL